MIRKRFSSAHQPRPASAKRWLHKLRHVGLSLLAFVAILFPTIALAALSITTTTTASTLQTALQGNNVVISNVTVSQGSTVGQVGTFSGGLTGGAGPVIGINDGVVMVTGTATTAAGPNTSTSISTGGETGPTDANLATVANGKQFDTAILQFNAVPAGNYLALDFAFGSDEYNEFVCTTFNDAMGVFVSGPGITGTANITRLSTTLSPISVNQINRGVAGAANAFAPAPCNLANSAFYTKNIADNTSESTSAGNSPAGNSTSTNYTNLQYDGFTIPLTAQLKVIPGSTYAFKVVIADIGDGFWDSGLFIDAVNSFDLDLGDAPDTYGTKPIDQSIQLPGPARHSTGQDIYLGTVAPDGESTVIPATSPNAANNDDTTGTDDEDAFSGDIAVPVGATSFSLNSIPVHNGTGTTAKLMGWIDFNKNGVFDVGELATATVSSGATTANLSWSGLSGITAGTSYARFRLTADTNLTSNPSPIGLATNGEVEDYRVIIANVVTIDGKVFDDADGSKFQNGSEAGTNGGGLNAVLVDSTNKVVASSAVASNPNGTYSFSSVPVNATYTVLVTTNTATVGLTPPAIALPSNWVSTGENLNGTADATIDSKLSVTVATSNVSNVNFGIEQRPTAVGGTASSQVNPGVLSAVPTSVFIGSTDPDGSVASYKITAFPSNASSIEINDTPYTSGNFPVGGITVTAAQLSTIKVFPNVGAVTVGISFQAIDNAGQSSGNTALANLPFTAAPVTLSGAVFDDADGSKIQNGTEAGTNGGGLNAVLIDSTNKVIASTAVAANGTYSFNAVPANANYTVLITVNSTTVGSAAPTVTLPSNWISTGENLNGTVIGTNNARLNVSVVTNNINNANFGIEQLPLTNNISATAQTNPGSTIQVQVPNLSGTDPEDGTLGSGNSFKIIKLPNNGTLYYNGIAVTAGQSIANYTPSLLTLDPNDGTVTITFTYAAVDAANQIDPASGTISIPFLQPTAASVPNLLLVKRITAINGSLQNGTVDLNTYDPDPTYPYDKNVIQAGLNPPSTNLWPNTTGATSSTFLIGARNGGTIQSGDEVEYTIDFLSAGSSSAQNAQLCDRIPNYQTFVLNGYNDLPAALNGDPTSNRGIAVSSDGSLLSYTNNDDGDTAKFYPAGSALPPVCGTSANISGAILVNLGAGATGTNNTPQGGTGGTIPNATAPGVPTASYGFVRFKAKVN